MKKRMFVGLFMCVACLLHLSVPSLVFGQSLAQRVFNTNKELLQREEIRASLPDALRILGVEKFRKALTHGTIQNILKSPRSLLGLDPRFDEQIIVLLTVDSDLQELFQDEQFFLVLKDEKESRALADLIENQAAPTPAKLPTQAKIIMVSGNLQEGKINTQLPAPFVVEVQDQNSKPLSDIDVNFKITKGKGSLSSTRAKTDSSGRSRVILMLGSELGIHQVEASVAGVPEVTFIAAAIGTTASESGPAPSLYWVDEGKKAIYHRPTGGVEGEWLKLKNGNLTGGLAVDAVGGRVYWTEKLGKNGRIGSAALDGTDVQKYKIQGAVPHRIVFEIANKRERRIYWTTSDGGDGRIQRMRIKADDSKTFDLDDLITGLNSPMHIALDNKKLYWTEPNRIMRANRNGKSKFKVVSGLGKLGGIAVANGVVYWTEKMSNRWEIRYVNGNGSGPKPLVPLKSVPQGLAVDPAGGRLYWTTAGGGIQSTLISPIHIDVENKGTQAIGLALGVPSTGSAPVAAAPSLHVADAVQNNLLANYPNPFNPETWIPYQLSEPAEVTVSIYGVNGSLIRTLALGHQSPGAYRSKSRAAYWDGLNELGERVASGLYFYTLTAGDFTATRKMLIRK